MRNRNLSSAGAPSGLRGLLRFWAIMLGLAIACFALLQIIGPPAQTSMRRQADQTVRDSGSANSSPVPPNAPIQDAVNVPEPKRHSQPAEDRGPVLRTRDDLALQALSTKLRLYEMARAAADSGKFDQADRFLGLAARLPYVDVETSASGTAQARADQAKPAGPSLVREPADSSQTSPATDATPAQPVKQLINASDTPARPNPTARNAIPAYPEIARERAEEGTVLLRVLVGSNGRTEAISVARSSGFADLDTAALASVRGWAFIPAAHAGTPVQASTEVTLRFRLVDSD